MQNPSWAWYLKDLNGLFHTRTINGRWGHGDRFCTGAKEFQVTTLIIALIGVITQFSYGHVLVVKEAWGVSPKQISET